MNTMTAAEIGAVLAKNPTSARCAQTIQACDPRRQEIIAKLREISPSPHHAIADPAKRIEALLGGQDQLAEQNREIEALRLELQQLDDLEFLGHSLREAALTREAAETVPAALARMEKRDPVIRETIAKLCGLIEEQKGDLAIAAESVRLGPNFQPPPDDYVVQFAETRERFWNLPDPPVPFAPPPDTESPLWAAYPRTVALVYEIRDKGSAMGLTTIRARRRPGNVYLPDVVPQDVIIKPEVHRRPLPPLAR